jgi:anti-sigma regulatory factor (Ser/Thr protein kinase)
MRGAAGCFHHESLFHSGDEGFVSVVLPFLNDAVGSAEAVLVAVSPRRIGLLRDALGDDADAVRFTDVRALGANPARIIPAWRDFLDEHTGGVVLGIGEPVWPGRDEHELAECQVHEGLMNTAFDGGPAWRLLCPYDLDALDPDVIEAAHRSHPLVSWHGSLEHSDSYASAFDPFAGELPDPRGHPVELAFTVSDLAHVRGLVAITAADTTLPLERVEDLILAVDELATNSICHGGGGGTLRLWGDDDALVCEVRDRGYVEDPLVGRVRPALELTRGRGLWLVNQLCDLMQIRSSPVVGTTVRVRMHTP